MAVTSFSFLKTWTRQRVIHDPATSVTKLHGLWILPKARVIVHRNSQENLTLSNACQKLNDSKPAALDSISRSISYTNSTLFSFLLDPPFPRSYHPHSFPLALSAHWTSEQGPDLCRRREGRRRRRPTRSTSSGEKTPGHATVTVPCRHCEVLAEVPLTEAA